MKKYNKMSRIYLPKNKANFYYERGLFALFALNLRELKEILAGWQVNQSLPFWEAKRAGLLAELGKVDEAKKILERSLKDIRSKLNLKTDFIRLFPGFTRVLCTAFTAIRAYVRILHPT